MKLTVTPPRLEFVEEAHASTTKFWPCIVFDVAIDGMTVNVVRRALTAAMHAKFSKRTDGTPRQRLKRAVTTLAERANELKNERYFLSGTMPADDRFQSLVPKLVEFAKDANARQPVDGDRIEGAAYFAAVGLHHTANRFQYMIGHWEQHGVVELHDAGWFTLEIRSAMARISAEYFQRPHVVFGYGENSQRMYVDISGRARTAITKLEAPLHMLHAARPAEVGRYETGKHTGRWTFSGEKGKELFTAWSSNFYHDPIFRSIMGVKIVTA
jgi:hypothetical protein